MLFLTYISLLPPTGINRKDTVTDSVDMVERQIETDKNEDRKFAIRTNNLTKRYGDTVAVDDLNLHVPTGEVYGFLGPNGAGKTTTMRLLTGLVAPDAGELSIAGTEVSGTGSVINVVGYAPTDPPVYDLLTGREQLHYLAELRELNIKNTDRIEKLFAAV
jgi:ABC-2 type transport system ATP-binding protein